MEKYIFLGLLVISIILFSYYLYALILNYKLNNKKQYIGEHKTPNRYKMKVRASSVSILVMCFLCVFSFNVGEEVTAPLLKEVSSKEMFEEISSSKAIKLTSVRDSYQQLETINAHQVNNSLYVSSTSGIIKYDILKDTSKTYLLDDVCNSSSVYSDGSFVVGYFNYDNVNIIKVFDLKLNLINEIEVNSDIVYVGINDSKLDIITVNKNYKNLCLSFSNKNEYLNYNELHYNGSINASEYVVHSKIDLNSFKVKKYGICTVNPVVSASDYAYILTDVTNGSLETKEIYKYDLKTMTVTSIKKVGVSYIESFESSEYGLSMTTSGYIYSFDEDFHLNVINKEYISLVASDSLVLEDEIKSIYLNENKSINSYVGVVSTKDYNVYKYAVLKDNYYNVFIKVNTDNNITYKYTSNDSLTFTNKYLIIYDLLEVKDIIVVNNEL